MAADAAPATDRGVQLILEPREELVFKGPFTERCSCQLLITNPSDVSPVAFKMKCTAAKYYASSPAVGIIPPKDTTVISVFLSELTPEDLVTIEYRRHRFGITYLPVTGNCTNDDVDRVLKRSPKDVQTAYLQSVIIPEGEEYMPGSYLPSQSSRERTRVQSLGDMNKPPPPKPPAKPVRRFPSGTEDSIIEEMRIEIDKYKEQNSRMKRHEEELSAQNMELKLQLNRVTAHEAELQRQLENIYQEKEKERNQIIIDFTREREEIMEQQKVLEEEVQRLMQENDTLKQAQKSINTDDISFWEISSDDLQIHEHIGSGAWGYVAKGTYKEQPVAIKCLHDTIVNPNTLSLLKREVAVMAKVRHPCLLLFIGVSFTHPSRSPMIVTELLYCSLRDTYKDPGKLSVKSKMKIMMDVACALHYLHTHKDRILHRDVSSANVLLVEKNKDDIYRGKLSDFGSANFTRFATTVAPGAVIYMAPEVFSEGRSSGTVPPQTSKVDVYSYGVLLSEVFTEHPQIPLNVNMFQQFLKSVEARFPFVREQIDKCIYTNPNDRPEIIDILRVFRSKFPNL